MILDTSVIFKWYVKTNEADTAKADLILKRFSEGTDVIKVPELVIYELANALYYCQRLTLKEKAEAMTNFFDLGVAIIAICEDDILYSFQIAQKHQITIYDAVYLSLAKRLQDLLITANPKHQKLGKGYQVVFLKDYS